MKCKQSPCNSLVINFLRNMPSGSWRFRTAVSRQEKCPKIIENVPLLLPMKGKCSPGSAALQMFAIHFKCSRTFAKSLSNSLPGTWWEAQNALALHPASTSKDQLLARPRRSRRTRCPASRQKQVEHQMSLFKAKCPSRTFPNCSSIRGVFQTIIL